MKNSGFKALFSIAAYVSLYCRHGLALDLQISPNEVNGLVPNNVTISCLVGLSATELDVKEVAMIQMVKDEAVMAAVSHDTRLYRGEGVKDNVEISPNEVNGLVPNNVTISCRVGLSATALDVKEVAMIQMVKDEDVMAVVSHSTRLFRREVKNNFEIEGDISGSIQDSFLRVKIINPEMEESCPYRCVLSYFNEDGIIKQTTKTTNLTVSNLEPKSAVRYLAAKVVSLELELSAQQEQISLLASKMNS